MLPVSLMCGTFVSLVFGAEWRQKNDKNDKFIYFFKYIGFIAFTNAKYHYKI
jgi:hypothetical protein